MKHATGDGKTEGSFVLCRDRQSATLAFQEAFKAVEASELLQLWRGAPLQYPTVPTGTELMAVAKQAAQLTAMLVESSAPSPDSGGSLVQSTIYESSAPSSSPAKRTELLALGLHAAQAIVVLVGSCTRLPSQGP